MKRIGTDRRRVRDGMSIDNLNIVFLSFFSRKCVVFFKKVCSFFKKMCNVFQENIIVEWGLEGLGMMKKMKERGGSESE